MSNFNRIGRLAVEGWSPRSVEQARELLIDGLRRLPVRVEYLVAPGGYVNLLKDLGEIGAGWHSLEKSLEHFRADAARVCKQVTSRLPASMRDMARYFSFGLDVRDVHLKGVKHAELVAVADLQSGEMLLLTGKTYPTACQEKTLVREAEWESHLWLAPNGDRVLVLGCHDLNVYNNRALSNASKDRSGCRYKTISDGRAAFKKFKPTHILHHPHATDIANTWRGAWSGVMEIHPKLEQGVSGIGHPTLRSREPDDIEVVLAATQTPRCTSADVVVQGNAKSFGRQSDAVPEDLNTAISVADAKRQRDKDMATYERGLAEWKYYEKYGKQLKLGARKTKPSPPGGPHQGIRATPENTCPPVTPSRGLALGHTLAAGAVGIVIGAGVAYAARRV